MRKQREDAGFGPKAIARGQELQRLMMLPWGDLFASQNVADGDFSPAKIGRVPKMKAEDACTCGKPHRQLFPRTQRSTHGHGFNVTYYCSDACKSTDARKRFDVV